MLLRSALLGLGPLAVFLTLAGCGESDNATPDDSGVTDSGEVSDTPDTATASLAIERRGRRIWGPILALSRVGRSLWIGTGAVQDPTSDTRVRGGLHRLDLDSGAVRTFESELPQRDYAGPSTGRGAVPTAGVVAYQGGVLAIYPEGLVHIAGATDTVTDLPMKDAAGALVPVFAAAVDDARKRVWVGTAAGIVRLDATNLAVVDRIELEGAQVSSLAVDTERGDAYAVVAREGAPAKLVLVSSEGVVKKTLTPGSDGVPAGSFSEVVFSKKRNSAFATLASFAPSSGGVVAWKGDAVSSLATEGALAAAATGAEVAFGATNLTLDDDDDLLIVGGRQRPVPLAATLGGGLVWLSLAKTGAAALYGSTLDRGLTGKHVRALAYDPLTRRTFTSVMEQCSDSKLASRGLTAVSFGADGSLRLERPILSGVRGLSRGKDATYAALRDEGPGAACSGYTVQGGLVKLLSNGAGEVLEAKVDSLSSYRTFRAGLTAVDVIDEDHVAAAGFFEEMLSGDLDKAQLTNLAGTFTVSNWVLDVRQPALESLFVGGRATHDPLDNKESYDDKAPRGLLWLQGGNTYHYVRTASGLDPHEVAGLPSSEITSILPEPSGGALVACATERLHSPTSADRTLEGPYLGAAGRRRGGIARIKRDGTLEIFADATVAPDPQAIARGTDGTLWVLDLERGLLHETKTGFEVVALPSEVKPGAWPHAVWAGGPSEYGAGFDLGATVTLGGLHAWVGDVGHVWRILSRNEGTLLLGTDEGIVRVHTTSAPVAAELAPAPGSPPPFGATPAK